MKTANSYNFKKICYILNCEDKYDKLVQSMVDYYSFCLVVNSSFCDTTQLDLLIKTLNEQKILNDTDYYDIYKSANRKACLLNTLHSKPIIYFVFLKTLHETELLGSLQVEIYAKIAEINNCIHLGGMESSCRNLSDLSTVATSKNTATLRYNIADATATAVMSIATTITSTSATTIPTTANATTTTATATIPIATTHVTNFAVTSPTTANSAALQSKHASTLPFNTEWSINKSQNPKCCENYMQNSTLSSDDVMAITAVVHDYQTHLKCIYKNLPEVSTQGWFDNSVQKQFINVTLVKSLEKDTHNVEEYYSSTQQMIKGEVVYGNEEYVDCNKIFQIDCSAFQLLLIEGNAGTGKTTFTYSVCKKWAQGGVLQQYSCIFLVQLRDIKPGDVTSLKALLGAVGYPVSNDLYTEISKTHGSGILIWLEGWDELDDSVVQNSAFCTLLNGKILPKANVVITTRPSATRSFKEFSFTHKFKIIGFKQHQIKNYVAHYCTNNSQSNLAEEFMARLNTVPGLAYLSMVPMYLAILVKLFKANRQLQAKLTDLCSDVLTVCLQHHKEKIYGNKQPIISFDELPATMQKTFYCMQKCAYEKIICHSQRYFTEEEVSQYFFNCLSVPHNFDGLGLFNVRNIEGTWGVSKTYEFQYKPIQEFLSALYLTRLKKTEIINEMLETFKSKEYEMVWLFYAGLTNLKQVSIEEVMLKYDMALLPLQPSIDLEITTQSLKELVKAWKQCHTYYMDMIGNLGKEILLSLILCCYEAKNSKACRVIAEHLYADKICRFEIPPNHATSHLLLAVSYFISHSGKTWSLRCNTLIQSSVELLFKHINSNLSYPEVTRCLWVLCCVVTTSEIDAYCDAIKSQSLLQWIHLLPGSYLGDDGAKKLCDCLYFDNQVIKIEIDECGIGSHGLRHIGRMLKVNNKILCVNIRRNDFALDDVKDFLQHIKSRPYLQSLLLDNNFCKNSEICTIIKEINLIRSNANSEPLIVTHR